MKVNTTLLPLAKTIGAGALKSLMSAGIFLKGALLSLGAGIKAAILPMLVPLAPFLAVGAAVVAGLALIITAIQSVREKFDQAPGMLSKLKLIVAAIITAPYVLFQKIAVFIAEKLGFTNEEFKLAGVLILFNNLLQSLFKSQILTLGIVMLGIFLMFTGPMFLMVIWYLITVL